MAHLKITRGKDLNPKDYSTPLFDKEIQDLVSDIISSIIENGDKSLIELTGKFDEVDLSSIKVPKEEIKNASQKIDSKTKDVLLEAIDNITEFHKNQISESWSIDYPDGSRLGELVRPIDRVGIYVPGGKAFYPSTMIMNTIPAKIASVPSIVVASPPGQNGLPHFLVLGICDILNIDEVYTIGGAQAIAALAYGTETISPVCKITGPGNKFVAEAKRQVFGKVGIDSIAGPSEIVILHDDAEVPVDFIVRDLLTQAEHDEEAAAILITTLPDVADRVLERIDELLPTLPRKEIIEAALKNRGQIILVDNLAEGIAIVNQIAPEHLELLIKDTSNIEKIRNAGAIFVGKWSTETVGDYFAGPNHTIPTQGAARYDSPLSVRDFQKHSSLIQYSQERLLKQGESIAQFAEMEELFAHAAAIHERLKRID